MTPTKLTVLDKIAKEEGRRSWDVVIGEFKELGCEEIAGGIEEIVKRAIDLTNTHWQQRVEDAIDDLIELYKYVEPKTASITLSELKKQLQSLKSRLLGKEDDEE